jgi:nicotinate-nucleotide adenylyltransferase
LRIGVLGGTFDPIHLGHLIISEEARSCLQLEEVVFVPTGDPWMKEGQPLSPAHHRFNMVRLATSSNPFFRASPVEIDRPGPTYTVDTLRALVDEYGPEVELFFILGADAFAGFHRWKDPQGILHLAKLAVVNRPGLGAIDPEPPVSPDRLVRVQGTNIEISATDIRRRVAEGGSIRYLVMDEIARYISSTGLYTS